MNNLLKEENGNPNIFKCVNEICFENPEGDNLLGELSTHSGCTEVHYKERNCLNYSGIHWQNNL